MSTGPGLPSYGSGTSTVPLLGDTIGVNFDRTVAAHGDRPAMVDCAADRRWTYRELADEVTSVALGLLELGVAKGDRVGIWSPNRSEWIVTQYASAKIGAILVNINPAYRTSELEFVLNQSGCKLLIAAQRLKTSDYAAMIAEAGWVRLSRGFRSSLRLGAYPDLELGGETPETLPRGDA